VVLFLWAATQGTYLIFTKALSLFCIKVNGSSIIFLHLNMQPMVRNPGDVHIFGVNTSMVNNCVIQFVCKLNLLIRELHHQVNGKNSGNQVNYS